MSTTVSVLFNEPKLLKSTARVSDDAIAARFSALQRAEIAEMVTRLVREPRARDVSVLFNEPKLLKFAFEQIMGYDGGVFQCSSTSRNC